MLLMFPPKTLTSSTMSTSRLCSIQFQSSLISFDLQWRWSVSFFQTILNSKRIRHILAYMEFSTAFVSNNLNNLIKLVRIPNSIIIFHISSLLSDFYASSIHINNWCTVPSHSNFFSCIWEIQNIWSVGNLPRGYPYWRFPIISSTQLRFREKYGIRFCI